MSTNKKIRKIYADTLRNFIQTEVNHVRPRQQLNSGSKNASPTANLPITLTDASIHLFSMHATSITANKPSEKKTAKHPEIKNHPIKKTLKK